MAYIVDDDLEKPLRSTAKLAVSKLEFLSTGCEPLDKILRGGIGRGEVTLIYGEPGTGKTSFAMQCAFLCAKKGFKTIFIDSDHLFSLDRLMQIAGNELDDVSSKILVFKPRSFQEQSLLVEDLDSYNLRNITLIVIDTVTSLYRLELDSAEKTFILNMKLSRQLAYLNELAKSYNTSIVLTSQVRTVFERGFKGDKIEPVANRVLKFWTQKIINLKDTSQLRVREATLEKGFNHIGDGASCFYMLGKDGIVNVNQHQPSSQT